MNAASHVPSGVLISTFVSVTCCADSSAPAAAARPAATVIDTKSRNGTGRGTSIDLKGVPIVYLPWMTFPVGPQRKSGFFFPSIGGGERHGAEVVLPYYWNIRPNMDLLAEPTYYGKRGVDFAGEFRYLTRRQRGSVDFNFLPGDNEYRLQHPDATDDDRTYLHLEHVAELPGDWRFRIDATDVGDTSYFEDFAHGPEGTSVPFTERLLEASYRNEHWNVRAQAQNFQTIDEDLPAIGLEQSDDVLDRYRLSRTGVPDDHHRLALGNFEGETLEHLLLAEGFVDVAERNHDMPAISGKRAANSKRSGTREQRAASGEWRAANRETPSGLQQECDVVDSA